MPTTSRRAVFTALTADLTLAAAKLVVWGVTGSSSMLSEAVHSLADSANQAFLVVGLVRAGREPDEQHPYGYGQARFVWALFSAFGVLFIGCGVTITHGVRHLFHPEPIEHPGLALGLLAVAAVLEGFSLTVGLRTVAAQADEQGTTLGGALRSSADTLPVAVVMEDGAALFGVAFAATALGLTWWTGDPRFDAVGSIAIGLVLGATALFLANRNRQLLLGRAPPEPLRARILGVLTAHPLVEDIKDVKVTMLGADAVRFKAEIEFDGRQLAQRYLQEHDPDVLRERLASGDDLQDFLEHYAEHLVDALGDAVDELEDEIRSRIPEARHVDLEAD